MAFERTLRAQPTNIEALTGLAVIDSAEHKLGAARERVTAAIKGNTRDPAVLVLAAQIALAEGKSAEGERRLREAIDANPNSMEAYGVLAQLYVRQNRLDDALKEYERIAAKQPDAVGPQTMVGMILQVQNRTDEAKARYKKVVEIDRRAVVASNNLAYIYLNEQTDLKNLQEALQLAQAAKSVLPNDPDVNDTLGWAYLKNDLVLPAIDALESAVKANPKQPEYQYHLGMAQLRAGNRAKARAALAVAVGTGTPFTGIEEARKALASIGG